MGRTSPVVAQFEFAARVRKRREELGLPAATVSKHCGFTRNFYSAVENSRSLLATAKLPLLIEALQFDADDAQILATLLEQARTPGWWQPYVSMLEESFVQFLGLEYGAAAISSYESLVFNGLLQCQEYATSVIGSSLNTSTAEKHKILETRLRRRKELFAGDDPPQMCFAFGEAVLLQQFGGVDVLVAQLRHVLDEAERLGDALDVRVRTFETTPVGLVNASTLVILEFEAEILPMIAYREAGAPLGATAEPELVDRLRLHYDQALGTCLSRDGSLSLIETRLAQLKS